MRRNLIKVIICVMISLVLSFPKVVLAISPGETFTVSASCGSIEGSITASASNATIISASNWCDRNATVTATAKAGSVGQATLSIITVDATDTDKMAEANGVVLGSNSVTVSNPQPTSPSGGNSSGGNSGNNSSGGNNGGYNQTTPPVETNKSDNADLASLSISNGTLTPQFAADVTEYSVALEKDVTSLQIEATAADEKANVSGTGEVKLAPGVNTLTIVVTAEDGTQKQYVIKANVDESPDVFMDYNGKQLGVVKNLNDTQPPTTFEPTTISLDGKEVSAYHSNLLNLTIVYMVDDANERNFYLYDEVSKKITSIFKPIALLGKNVFIIDIPKDLQTRSGMKYGEVSVDEQSFMGWSFDDPAFKNYSLLYLMDEKGNKQYYLYESSENTLQLYSGQAGVTQERYEDVLQDFEQRGIFILALALSNVVVLILLIIALVKKRKPKKSKVVVKAAADDYHSDAIAQAENEEEIIPFDAWKYEDSIPDQGIHLQPYEHDSHLFDSQDGTNNG
ncbi:MAG: cadherin-like beta sandwich domain-containing protein [Erysipelotrichaceae bacterium]|nr:cadherin-like beta sandwich domain-containing protein [Erysipelotrichaceae bacterium]MCI9312820.1 cadherin-like beta sandwich domain-containing protein [Erysipelotrichaceae bacterium]